MTSIRLSVPAWITFDINKPTTDEAINHIKQVLMNGDALEMHLKIDVPTKLVDISGFHWELTRVK